MTADSIVGERVHNLMWRNRVSQTRLATLLGLAQPNVGKRLRGDTSWTLDELLVVARFFEVPLIELLPGEDYDPNPQGRGRKAAAGGGTAFLPIESWCAIRDLNPEPADSKPRSAVLSIVGRIPIGPPVPAPRRPETPRRSHLVLVGGAA